LNAVLPGNIEAPITDRFTGGGRSKDLGPLGRVGKPEEIAEAVMWMCSELGALILVKAWQKGQPDCFSYRERINLFEGVGGSRFSIC
jgi:NAD(P)-dependent dehydrogenase (short-subunit alcohol dehydrogenase family)